MVHRAAPGDGPNNAALRTLSLVALRQNPAADRAGRAGTPATANAPSRIRR